MFREYLTFILFTDFSREYTQHRTMAPVSRSNLQMSDDESEDENDEKTPLVENPYDIR